MLSILSTASWKDMAGTERTITRQWNWYRYTSTRRLPTI
jgi:hypothetical protein